MRTTVPIRIAAEDKPLLVIPTVVDGQGPFDFVLDTGASHLVIDAALATQLELPHLDEEPEARGAGGPVAATYTHLSSLSVGDATLSDTPALIMDLSTIAATVGTKLEGIIGYPFLARHVVTIDYPNRLLHLDTPAPAVS